MAIKDRIKEMRQARNLTQEQLAKRIGIAKSTLAGYETGIREPSIEIIGKIMYELDIDANYLWQDEGNYQMQVSYLEMEHIKKYHNLDDFGKESVDIVLERESRRVEEINRLKEKTNVEFSSEIVPMCPMAYYQKMASAGRGEFLFNDIPTDIIEVPETSLSRRANFVLGVNGHSMENTYFDGDKVLVEKSHNVPVGEIGVFIREGECFIKEAGKDRLISHNEDKEKYPDIIPDEREIDTIGIVLGRVGE